MKRSILFLLVLCVCFTTNGQIITTIAGTGSNSYNGEGLLATVAGIQAPRGVAVDKDNNIYVSCSGGSRIRKISSGGIVTTIAGNGVSGFSGDGDLAVNASIGMPMGIAIDQAGNILFCDVSNNRVRKIDIHGIITTVAGNGDYGYGGDGGPATAAKIWNPYSVCVDQGGNILIADNGNNRIRKVNSGGIISTIAGTGVAGYNGDNIPATDAMINRPSEVVVDNSGSIYVSDPGNRRIRMLNSSGNIITVAGTGYAGLSGDNGPATSAQIKAPYDIVFDKDNNLYFADLSMNCVRKISTSGLISRVAGVGGDFGFGFGGDGGNATDALLNSPHGLAFDNSGGLLIADFGNSRIRRVSNVVATNYICRNQEKLVIFPNPTSGLFNIETQFSERDHLELCVIDISGQIVLQRKINSIFETVDESLPSGQYLILVVSPTFTTCSKLVVQP